MTWTLTMRPFLIPALAVSALLAACDSSDGVRISSTRSSTDEGGALKVISALQCPETQGDLIRKGSAQSGGTVCTYTGPRGSEVSLHLVSLLDGETPDIALMSFEDQLSAAMPHTLAQIGASERAAANAVIDADAAAVEADAAAAAADRAADAADQAASEAERATVRLPGMSVDADGDKARVRMPGMTVDADGDRATVRIGGITIDADEGSSNVDIQSEDESVFVRAQDDAAQIRTRAPGEATRMTFLLTDNRPSDAGWRLVGYEARGPRGGPMVVATVRAKDNNDRVFDDAKNLVTLNVGE